MPKNKSTCSLEKVYENGLANRLKKAGHEIVQQHPIKVYDEDGTILGDYYADLFVDQTILVELKAVKALTEEHKAQVFAYMRATKIAHSVLINFGAPKLQINKYIL